MHLGVIPDGNRRYADNNDIPKKEAYRQAKDVLLDNFKESDNFDVDIESVTFYLLSEKNLKRDEGELQTLYELFYEHISELIKEFGNEDFRFNWATTRPSGVPKKLEKKLRKLEKKFDAGERTLNTLISYDGKKDIVQASREIAGNGGNFSKEALADHLQVEHDIDFVIRTGDNPTRECLSGFPIWNSSYSEFYHIKKNFPAIEKDDVEEALQHFQRLRRKKGE